MPSSPASEVLTFADIEAAAQVLKGVAVVTPVLESPLLNQALGFRLRVKAEPLQITGSFKFRGAYNAISRIPEAERAAGRPIKDKVEVSASGRVRQTAYRAAEVERPFRDASGNIVTRIVPGSFYEFITRDPLPETLAVEAGRRLGRAIAAGHSGSSSGD